MATTIRIIGLTFILAQSTQDVLAGGTRYVDASAAAGGDGLSWQTAYVHLQDALATADVGVVEIRVAQGVYVADRSADAPDGTGDRDATFSLRSGLAIRGGYAGLQSDEPDQRDPLLHETVLSGDLLQNDGPDFAGMEENVYHVVTALNVDQSAVLDGVTVVGGRADGPHFGPSPESRDQGSAVNVYHSTPTLRECTFRNNWAINHGTVNDHGGATVVNCTYEANYARSHGAGHYIHAGVTASVTLCFFQRNRTPGDGAGAYCQSDDATFSFCFFDGNIADNHGGGLYHATGSAVTVVDCTFANNRAETGGGQYVTDAAPIVERTMHCLNFAGTGGGLYAADSLVLLNECSWLENDAPLGDGGAGVWLAGGEATVADNVFLDNVGFNGAGLYLGHAIQAEVRDCLFRNNQAINDNGGGISNADCDPLIERCLFEDNGASTNSDNPFVSGGAIANYLSAPIIRDCVFRRNSSTYVGGAIYCEGPSTPSGNYALIDSCVFEDNRAEDGGAIQNFYSSPVIVNSVFAHNVVASDRPFSRNGGAIMNNYDCFPTIRFCTFVANSGLAGGAIMNATSFPVIENSIFWDNEGGQIADEWGGAAELRFCNIEGGWGGVGEGNFAANPAFSNPVDREYGLDPASPCIDAGDPNYDQAVASTLDLAKNPRVINCRVDVGAFESTLVTMVPGDLDRSGVVGEEDIDAFVRTLTGQGSLADECIADLTGDGAVTVRDINPFVAAVLGR